MFISIKQRGRKHIFTAAHNPDPNRNQNRKNHITKQSHHVAALDRIINNIIFFFDQIRQRY